MTSSITKASLRILIRIDNVELFSELYGLLRELYPDINLFELSLSEAAFSVSKFLLEKAEHLTEENYNILSNKPGIEH